MKKLVFLIVIILAASTAVQAEVKAGDSPAVDTVEIAEPDSRSGALPPLDVDNKTEECVCPPCCDKPTIARIEEQIGPDQEKVTMIIDIEFNPGNAVVEERFYEDIDMLAKFLKEFPEKKVVIEGYSDNVGDEKFNRKLSEKRAGNVRKLLIDKFGINGSRITAVGYGSENPVASNDTEEGRQQNRRVEALVEVLRKK